MIRYLISILVAEAWFEFRKGARLRRDAKDFADAIDRSMRSGSWR